MTPHRLNLGGWMAFSVSGVLFSASAIADGDPVVLAGSLVWLAGVGFFVAAWRRSG